MAIHWTIPLSLFAFFLTVQGRSPGLYWPTGRDDHPVQTRTHLDESALNGLTENELETLLYLLDKADHPRAPPVVTHHQKSPSVDHQQQYSYAHPYFETRNKRTGNIHHGGMQKKAVDWTDYWGIDKREVKSNSIVELTPPPPPPSSTASLPDAKDDKEREEILNEFYSNMAMAANVKRRRKRAIKSNAMDKDMKKVGDNLIWDALKLTGAHNEKMNKEEFKAFKKDLIKKIGAAYDLEKLRHIFEGNINKFSSKNKIEQ